MLNAEQMNWMPTRWRAKLPSPRQLPAWVKDYILPAVVALLFVIFWTQSQAIDPQQHSQYVSALRQLQELDARINQNLLQIKLGLLNNYDPIVEQQADVKALEQLLAKPPTTLKTARLQLGVQLEENRQLWQEKSDLIQDFKTSHAVLRNSLAYFPLAVAQVSRESDAALAADLNTLLRDLLLFNLSAARDTAELERSIQQLGSRDNPALDSILSHANLILTNRPVTDRLIEAILTVPTRQQGTLLAETYDVAYQRAIRRANVYRVGLYALLTALAIALVSSVVSRLRAAAIAQQQSENTQQAMFQAIPDFMLRMYRNSPLYDVVSAGKGMIPIPQTRHGNLRDVLPAAVAERRLAAVDQVLQTRTIEIYEQQIERQGQPVWEEVRVVPCGKNDVLVMVRDICDRKQAEAELRQATKAAQMANKAKSQFLSNMSHELRTPLNVILGFAQLMTRSNTLDPQQRGYLNSINQSGEHLLSLINDVLEMSKIEAGKTTLSTNDFDLQGLLSGIYTMFQFKASAHGVQLHLETADNLPQYIHTDGSKLRQVLINLVGNAVKFTEAGDIYLRAAIAPTEAAQLGDSTAMTLTFEVEDTGRGIPADDIAQLFNPFSQASNHTGHQEGTGLGLPISKKFAEMMGGGMAVSSQVGVGSQFSFSIQAQIARSAPTLPADRAMVGLAPGQPTYRILIVEDMPKNRELLTNLLMPVGFEVREACNGQEAISVCEQWRPDLVWMDLRMPVMDGYEATRELKRRQLAPLVIALTGSAFKQEENVAFEAGCDDFVCKPFRTAMLFEKMSEYLGAEYLYESNTSAEVGLSSEPTLTAADIQAMPAEWRTRLRDAATKVNGRKISQLLKEVPPEQAKITRYISQLVENFCFEEIVSLSQ